MHSATFRALQPFMEKQKRERSSSRGPTGPGHYPQQPGVHQGYPDMGAGYVGGPGAGAVGGHGERLHTYIQSKSRVRRASWSSGPRGPESGENWRGGQPDQMDRSPRGGPHYGDPPGQQYRGAAGHNYAAHAQAGRPRDRSRGSASRYDLRPPHSPGPQH